MFLTNVSDISYYSEVPYSCKWIHVFVSDVSYYSDVSSHVIDISYHCKWCLLLL
jgi:hypothetical protein